jgi:hypothetical protein
MNQLNQLNHLGEKEKDLYQRLQSFSLDEANAIFPFGKRLAKENRWTLDYSQRVIEEYKKFAFLAVVAGHPVTPSDQVDQVWHLHLLYTHSYWEEFCPEILQRSLHHGPTKGGRGESDKFHDWYSKTLASYQTWFGEVPPEDIWSPSHIRFGRDIHFYRVNTQDNWIISKSYVKYLRYLKIFLVCLSAIALVMWIVTLLPLELWSLEGELNHPGSDRDSITYLIAKNISPNISNFLGVSGIPFAYIFGKMISITKIF